MEPKKAMQEVFQEMLGRKSVDGARPPLASWTANLERHGGFWSNMRWRDLHLERRMPLALKMIEELVCALPPLPESCKVCDLAGGSGRLAAAILEAYPGVSMTLVEASKERLDMALQKMALEIHPIQKRVDPGSAVPGGPYDVIVMAMSTSCILGEDVEGADAIDKHNALCAGVFKSLRPGGHFLIGDHVGMLPLYVQMISLDQAGFHSVDCAWRENDFFVIGGRRAPEENKVTAAGSVSAAFSNLFSSKSAAGKEGEAPAVMK